MKKTNITIPFEDNKLRALRLFTYRKDIDIESELKDAAQKLYEKYVPKDARDLVDMMDGGLDIPKSKAVKKPESSRPAAGNPDAVKTGPGLASITPAHSIASQGGTNHDR